MQRSNSWISESKGQNFDSNSIKLQEEKIMQLKSQEMRKLAPELDPLRIGTGWKKEDLGKVQVMVESTYGDSILEVDI